MNPQSLLPAVRFEVEKPFEEKLAKAQMLLKMWGKVAPVKPFVSCSFGKDSTVVLYLALQVNPNIPVVFNNTGVEWKETLEFRDYLRAEWHFNLIETKPKTSFWEVMEKTKRKHLHQDDGKKHSNLCCTALKHGPLHRVVKEYGFTHSFTGITAVESRHRMFTACERGMEYFSKKDGFTKIHPILYWTEEEVWRFTKENNIPVNPTYAKYKLKRIGCVPCTSWKNWRKQLARTNPAMYRLIQERYFGQTLLEAASE